MKGFDQIRENLSDDVEQEGLFEAKDYLSKLDPRIKPGYDEKTDKQIPTVVTMKRKAIRQYPDHQKIALYYAQSIDKYISIPFGKDGDSGPAVVNEDRKTISNKEVPTLINNLNASKQSQAAVSLAVDHINHKGDYEDIDNEVLQHPDVQAAITARANKKKAPAANQAPQQTPTPPQAAPTPAPPSASTTQQQPPATTAPTSKSTHGVTASFVGKGQGAYTAQANASMGNLAQNNSNQTQTTQSPVKTFKDLHDDLDQLHQQHQAIVSKPKKKITSTDIAQLAALNSMKMDIYHQMGKAKDFGGMTEIPGVGDTAKLNPKAAASALRAKHTADLDKIKNDMELKAQNSLTNKYFAPVSPDASGVGEIIGRTAALPVVGLAKGIGYLGKKVMGIKEETEIKNRFKARYRQKLDEDAMDSVNAGVRSFSNSLTFGGADYLSAGGNYVAKKVMGKDTTFDDELKQQQQISADSAKEHPTASTIGDVAGYLGVAKAGLKIGAKIGAAALKTSVGKKVANFGKRVAANVMGGAASSALTGGGGGGAQKTIAQQQAQWTTPHDVQKFSSDVGGGRLAGAQATTAAKSDQPVEPGALPTTVQKSMSQGWAKQARMQESVVKDIRKIRMKKLEEATIYINEEPITINNNVAEKVMTVYKSLNKENRSKFESMLNEDVESFKKAVNFALRY